MQKLNEHACDGLIAIAPSGSVYEALCKPEFNTVPTVVIGLSHPSLSEAGRAVIDIEPDIMGRGVEYLVGLGHEKIAYFSCDPEGNSMICQRNRDFRNAVERFSLHVGKNYIMTEKVPSWYEAARERVLEFSHSKDCPTAILTMSTMFAFGAWQGAMEAGLRIPEDISILGVECNKFYNPRLSTILQPLKKIAEKAAEIMMATLLSGKNMDVKPFFFPAVIEERGSCMKIKREN